MQTHSTSDPSAVLASPSMANRDQSKALASLGSADAAETHRAEQFLYQGAVVVAVMLFLVSLWSL